MGYQKYVNKQLQLAFALILQMQLKLLMCLLQSSGKKGGLLQKDMHV